MSLKVAFNKNGFSLVQVIIVAGLLGGLSLFMMKINQNITTAHVSAESAADEIELATSIRMILDDPRHCRVSLAGDLPSNALIFEKIKADGVDDDGLNVELYLASQDGTKRGMKKFNDVNNPGDEDRSRYGRLLIKSMKLFINNGSGFNYNNSSAHNDIGQLKVIVEKKISATKSREIPMEFDVKLGLSTGLPPQSNGETKIISCSREQEIKNQELECYTIRRFEKYDYNNYFIDERANGQTSINGLSVNDVITMHGGCCIGNSDATVNNLMIDVDPLQNKVGLAHANKYYGMTCNSANDFFMAGCTHSSSEDSDTFMSNNGCFAGRNDGDRTKNMIDLRCCRYKKE